MAPPPPRGTSPIVWILVAVAGIFVLGGLALVGTTLFVVHKARQAGMDPDLWRRNPGMAVGKLLAAANPDLDVVRTDDRVGTITIRNRRTGKETTMTFDQARNGRFSMQTEDENGKRANIEIGGAGGKLPSWVPEYPGSQPTFALKGSSDSGEEGGNFTFTTSDSTSQVMSFYQDKIKTLGMEAKLTTTTATGGMLVASREGDDRSLTVIVGGGGQTTVNVTYARKR